MQYVDPISRKAARGRWLAAAAFGLILATGSLLVPSALGQAGPVPRKSPPDAAAKAAPEEKLSQEEIQRRAAADLAASQPEKTDAKTAKEGGGEPQFDIVDVVRKGGAHMWALYAIILTSALSVAFGFERLLGLRRSKILPADLVAGLRALVGRKGEFDLRQAGRLCKQYPSSGAVVLRAMLSKVGRPVAEIEHTLSDTAEREASRLYANVRWQTLVFNVAPMLGLAGTVHGMIIAFFVTANMTLGEDKMHSLSTGIYAALICTFAGIVAAIPAGIMAHFFEGRIMGLFRELDDVARALVPYLEKFEGRLRAKAPAEKGAGEPVTLEIAHDPDEQSLAGKGKRPAAAPKE